MYLRAQGEFYQEAGESGSLPELKDLVTETVGQPIRRISRFMQLALIGAGRCARGIALPPETAVYLASSRGDLEISVDVMNHMFREGQAPKPLSFVNTVSNSAAFYVAKCLGLRSRSAFVSSRYFAFEDAMLLALTDLRLGLVDSALIGCVESVVLPLSAQRERLEVEASTPLAEASHWMWFSREPTAGAQHIVDVVSMGTQQHLLDYLQARPEVSSNPLLSAGQYLATHDFTEIRSRLNAEQSFDYRGGLAYYPSQSAAAISAFRRSRWTGKSLFHVNSDSIGRRSVLVLNQ